MRHFASLAVVSAVASAWWDGGHYLSMAVAKRVLDQRGGESAYQLVEKFLGVSKEAYPGLSNFYTVCNWPDYLKKQTKTISRFHYLDLPFATNTDNSELKVITAEEASVIMNNGTLIGAIEPIQTMINTLVNGDGSEPFTVARRYWATEHALRQVFHYISDIHMPLHAVGWWHEIFCTKGNQASPVPESCSSCEGGNYVNLDTSELVNKTTTARNLHQLWDSMGGYATLNYDEISLSEMDRMAAEMMEMYPMDANSDFRVDVEKIMMESYEMCTVKDADGLRVFDFENMNMSGLNAEDYSKNSRPVMVLSDKYVDYVERESKRRVVQAGWRIADLVLRFNTSTSAEMIDNIPKELPNGDGASRAVGCSIVLAFLMVMM